MKLKIFIFILLCQLSLNNSFELKILDNSFIYINVGTPKQKLKFYIDFQMNLNVIFSHKFNSQLSTSLNKSHIYYNFNSSQGIFSGIFSKDKFEFENNIFNLYFLLTNFSSYKNFNFDGIIGLGFSDKNSLLNSFSFISFLKRENLIDNEIISINNNGNLIIGKSLINEKFNIYNQTEINLTDTKKTYPNTFSLIKGISFFSKKNLEFHKESNFNIAFELNFAQSITNQLIISNNIFDKFYTQFLDENDLNNSLSLLKENSQIPNHEIITFQNHNYESGFFFNESNSINFHNENSNFQIEVSSDFDDFIFFNLNFLKSEIIIFDYEKMKLILYNCLNCGLKKEDENNYKTLFMFIFLFSLISIIIMILVMKSMIKKKKVTHTKFLKTYNLII